MVHSLLESPVEMRVGLCGGAEAHLGAEVVSPRDAEFAAFAHDAGFDRYALADAQVGDTLADGGDHAGGFMAEDEWVSDDKVAVPPMQIVVHCAGVG